MTDPILHIDYETRSREPLFQGGAYRYARHPSTDILCLGWAFDDDVPQIWIPGKPFPERIREHVSRGAHRSIHAHNAAFERLITNHVLSRYVDFPPIDIGAWYCTAAQARARSLPAGLDDLGRCLRLATKKDVRGKELIRQLSIPTFDKTTGTMEFREDADLLQEMYDYCLRDVEVERMAAKATQPLTDDEYAAYVANERVNDRGLMIDLPLAEAAASYADAELAEINTELSELTAGKITSTRQVQRLKEYIEPLMVSDELVRDAVTRTERDRKTGETKTRISLDRTARARLMGIEEIHAGRFDPTFLRLLELIESAGRSSVAKYRNMVTRAEDDTRVRGAYIFGGASQTGRFSSAGLQVHNFPRSAPDDVASMRSAILNRDPIDNVMSELSKMLRPAIMARRGHQFVCGDWSQIEARMLPWLTGEGERVLDVFRGMDADPSAPDNYMLAASDIFGKPAAEITKDERAVGKVVVLACGYAGGVGAFNSMARAFGVVLSEDQAREVIYSWRATNDWAVQFWRALERGAIDALHQSGTSIGVGRLTFYSPPGANLLFMQLPSGRVISYPEARVDVVETQRGSEFEITAIKANWRPAEGDTYWPRVRMYGGLMAENATQAAAADILRRSLVELDELEWPVVGHTHDELLLEVETDEVDEAQDQLRRAMLHVPDWAEGLPLNCELWTGRRYRK